MGYPLAPELPTQLLPNAVIEKEPYPIKAAFFHITNPMMSQPNTRRAQQMMSELELAVTIDVYLSETALASDVVLPEASFYERAEVREGLWSGPQVILSQPAIPPRGESKPIYEIIKGLAQEMGYGKYFKWDTWEDWARRMTKDIPISFEELKERGCWEGELRYHKFQEEGFKTLTGQIEALSESFQMQGVEPLPVYSEEHRVIPDEEYPFQVTSSKMRFHCNLHTQENPYLMQIENENWVELNPQDANRYDIFEGDRIEVASPIGKVEILARTSENVRPGVVRVIHGHGFGRTAGVIGKGKGGHFNPLIGTNVNPVSGGIGYNECKVKIRKI
jgi:thiosulfate reductase/polysulfide reductase chain A